MSKAVLFIMAHKWKYEHPSTSGINKLQRSDTATFQPTKSSKLTGTSNNLDQCERNYTLHNKPDSKDHVLNT